MAAARFYRLARQEEPMGYGVHWVTEVAVSFEDGVRGPVEIAEGGGNEHHGARLSAAEMLTPGWDEKLEIAGGGWLRPYLALMARGERVLEGAAVAHYAAIHGTLPSSYEAEAGGVAPPGTVPAASGKIES